MPDPRRKISLWTGEVDGSRASVFADGHTEFKGESGFWMRSSDANEIVAACVSQLVERLGRSEGTIQKLRLRDA